MRGQLCDRRAHHRFLSARADSPACHAEDRKRETAKEDQRCRRCGGHRRKDHRPDPDAVEQRSQDQGAGAVDSHSDRIEDWDPGRRHHIRSAKVIGNQRKIDIARGDECHGEKVNPEDRRQAAGFEGGRGQVEIVRPRKQVPRGKEHRNRQHCRDDKHGETRPVIATGEQDRADHQGAGDGAGLVECLVQAEAPKPSPVWLLACDNIASRAGVRIARPIRSAMIRMMAICQFPASAKSGTANRLRT